MIKDDEIKSLQHGHRARLRQKFLDGNLADYEILELLLTYAIPRRDVRLLARRLDKKYGGILRLLSTPYEELLQNDGIKEGTATFLKVIQKLLELDYKIYLDDAPIFHNYEKLERYCLLTLGGKSVEEFHVLYLDNEHKLIKDDLHSVGTVDWTAVYVREIVKKALDLNARSVILLHNHPTPGMSFSEQDIKITQELIDTFEKLNVDLYDHLLVSGNIVYSANNMMLIKKRINHSSDDATVS